MVTRKVSVKDKFAEIMRSPIVEKTSSIASNALEIVSKVGMANGNPIAIAGALWGAVNMVAEVLDVTPVSETDRYIEEHNLVKSLSNLAVSLARSGLMDSLQLSTLAESKSDGRVLLGIDIDGDILAFHCVLQNNGSETVNDSDSAADSGAFVPFVYRSPGGGAAEDHLRDKLWQVIGSSGVEMGVKESDMYFTPMNYQSTPYLGDKSPLEFADNAARLRSKGISPSFIFYGPGGTGKTTFVLDYAELVSGRVLLVGPNVFDAMYPGDIERIVDLLRPEVLLFDDLDKAGTLNGLYTSLPGLRRFHPNMTTVLTCNDPKRLGAPLLRPGRVGEMIRFGPPDMETRVALMEMFMGLRDIDSKAFDLVEIAELMNSHFTHDWVRHLAEQAFVHDTQDRLVAYTKATNVKLDYINDSGSMFDSAETEDEGVSEATPIKGKPFVLC